MSVELVAMAPWGDGIIVRRETGDLYLRMPEGAPGSRSVSESDVAEAVGQHGYLLVNEPLADMAAIERRVSEIVASNPPPPLAPRTIDASDVRRFLPSLVELASTEATANEARVCALRYLEVDGVRLDKDLHSKLLKLLKHSLPESSATGGETVTGWGARWSQLRSAA
jgi:hypothetical protein